jgi:hypothetical protein
MRKNIVPPTTSHTTSERKTASAAPIKSTLGGARISSGLRSELSMVFMGKIVYGKHKNSY